MGRPLKPQEVGQHYDRKLRLRVPLMLDRNTLTFFAEVETTKIEAKSVEELRRLVDAKVLGLKSIEWVRVIELELEEKDTHRSWNDRDEDHRGDRKNRLEFNFERYEIGETASGHWLMRGFDEDLDDYDRDRRAENPTHKADDLGSWRKEKTIPYSEEAWAALLEIDAGVDRARERLAKFFSPKTAPVELAAMARPQLPAGEPVQPDTDGKPAPTFEQRVTEQNKRKARARSGGFTSK